MISKLQELWNKQLMLKEKNSLLELWVVKHMAKVRAMLVSSYLKVESNKTLEFRARVIFRRLTLLVVKTWESSPFRVISSAFLVEHIFHLLLYCSSRLSQWPSHPSAMVLFSDPDRPTRKSLLRTGRCNLKSWSWCTTRCFECINKNLSKSWRYRINWRLRSIITKTRFRKCWLEMKQTFRIWSVTKGVLESVWNLLWLISISLRLILAILFENRLVQLEAGELHVTLKKLFILIILVYVNLFSNFKGIQKTRHLIG